MFSDLPKADISRNNRKSDSKGLKRKPSERERKYHEPEPEFVVNSESLKSSDEYQAPPLGHKAANNGAFGGGNQFQQISKDSDHRDTSDFPGSTDPGNPQSIIPSAWKN